MSPETLALVGEALYGPNWQNKLARALEINDRTVRRWASGENEIADWLHPRLIELVEDHLDGLEKALGALKSTR